MNPTVTWDIDPADLDFTDDGIAFITEIFHRMKSSKQAEFLADVDKRDTTVDQLIKDYKALTQNESTRFLDQLGLKSLNRLLQQIETINRNMKEVTEGLTDLKELL